MKSSREEAAPDRDAWEKAAREAATRLDYAELAPGKYRRGSAGAFHPATRRHDVEFRWENGRGIWEATACGRFSATARFLEARLDELQGKVAPGSGLSLLARAAAGGFLAWVFATATLFIFTVPLCRDAQREWAAKQAFFESKAQTHRAPIASRVREVSIPAAAFIPAASLGFLAAIPLCLLFLVGELLPSISRWNLPSLGTACLVMAMALVSPGTAVTGLIAGLLAPLAAWAAYAGVRAVTASGRAPSHGPRWAAGVASLAVLAAVLGASFNSSLPWSTARDRILFGSHLGEKIATFYYRNTPLAAYALRPLESNARNTLLSTGPIPPGFPVKQYHFLECEPTSKEEFLRLASGDEFSIFLYNEDAAPWAADAAREFRQSHPSRAAAFMAISKGGIEKVFPEASPDQFLDTALLRAGADPQRVSKFNAALSAAYERADRRHTLRDIAHLSNVLVIFLGPLLLLGAWCVGTTAAVVSWRQQGLKRAAGALAAASTILVLGLAYRVATSEAPLQKHLKEMTVTLERLRGAAVKDAQKQGEFVAEGKRDLPELTIASVDPEIGVRVLAMDALGALGSFEALRVLGSAVNNDPSPLVRYRAADAIGRFAAKDQRISFLSLAQNDEIYVAEEALDSMLQYRP